ncbi:MAG: hypothetical protein NZ805_03190 [Armatimonadetes bacterium]|nr:hypothetical protein [Armatimonadota bacterium]MDW8029052.1 hypothetical protein [Armatimonadota bacterium]
MRKVSLTFALITLILGWLLSKVRQPSLQMPNPSPLYQNSLFDSLRDLDILEQERMKAWK